MLLFLRSQLISGRWNIFMDNINNWIRKHLDSENIKIDEEKFYCKSAA